MIQYQIDAEDSALTKVYLDGRLVGAIHEFSSGFYYAPKGSKLRGENFTSIEAVKASIEGE